MYNHRGTDYSETRPSQDIYCCPKHSKYPPECTRHTITVKSLRELILQTIKRVAGYVRDYERRKACGGESRNIGTVRAAAKISGGTRRRRCCAKNQAAGISTQLSTHLAEKEEDRSGIGGCMNKTLLKAGSIALPAFLMLKRRSNHIAQKLKRNINMGFRVNEDEKYFIEKKMEEVGWTNFRNFVLHCLVRGEIVKLDLAKIREMNTLLRRVSNNVNQIAARVNATNRVYETDIAEIQSKQSELWEQ